MTDRISSVTKALLTLSMFFVCATIGAALALFVGWPVAILSGIVGFILVQQIIGGFSRRRDKRAQAKEMAHLRKNYLEVETALHETRARLGDLSGQFEQRANHQEKKIVAELKVLETLMRDFAGKISRGAAEIPHETREIQHGPTGAYIQNIAHQLCTSRQSRSVRQLRLSGGLHFNLVADVRMLSVEPLRQLCIYACGINLRCLGNLRCSGARLRSRSIRRRWRLRLCLCCSRSHRRIRCLR